MMVKNPKSYTFNRDAILVETTTGAKRALIDYRKNPPQPYNQKKCRATSGHFLAYVI